MGGSRARLQQLRHLFCTDSSDAAYDFRSFLTIYEHHA
jgi:hypothetical protein